MTPIETDNDRRVLPPDVTVVIPAFNLQNYLEAAVLSVLRQTYRGKRSIIILDDGSSDGTLAVARAIAARTPSVTVITQANQGRVGARNRLLELAPTELVGWLDGDDIAAPDWLADQIELLMSDKALVAVSGQGYAMTADGFPIGPIEAHPLTSEEIEQRHIQGHANAFFQSCVVVKKSAVLRAGGYRDKYPAGEDYDLWLRLTEVGRLANVDKCHLLYRVHAQSANATISVQQRLQGLAIANEARCRRGLPPLLEESRAIPPQKKDDWDRRIYYINIALKSGNPRTALSLLRDAMALHPASLLMWLLLLVALLDTLLLAGNRTQRFEPGSEPRLGSLPYLSAYRFGRALNRLRRRALGR